ncbi:MAG: fibronectin type III-like domain-contianing protein, partial [Microthrixaceae bacterium]
YSTFEWSPVELSSDEISVEELTGGATTELSVQVRNVGSCTDAAVVQCYVHDVEHTMVRPEQELRGFAKVELPPGESATVTIPLDLRSLAVWDPEAHDWRVEPGEFQVRVAESSRVVRSTARLVVTG